MTGVPAMPAAGAEPSSQLGWCGSSSGAALPGRAPRSRPFAPDVVWRPRENDNGRCPVLSRAQRPGQWRQAVYRPQAALITQVADGAVRPEDGPRTTATSPHPSPARP